MSRHFSVAALGLLLLSVAPAARADLKVKQKSTFGGQSFESTVLIKGARQRSESQAGAGQVSIMQCDLRRTLMLNEQTRRYFVYRDADAAPGATDATAAAHTAAPARRGGTVTYTTNITDTGERRQMFGLTARHLKTKLTVEPSADACDQNPLRLETDGWYTDAEFGLNCPSELSAQMPRPPVAAGGCQDRVVTKQTGTGRLGYPLQVTTTIYGPDGSVTSTSSTEVVELSRAPLAAALFDVPAGYTEVKSTQELYGLPTGDAAGDTTGAVESAAEPAAASEAAAAAAAKRPGGVRVGVAQVKNLTDKTVAPDAARAHLVSALADAGLEAVPLNAYTPAALDAEAKQKACDFVLTTDVTALKSSAGGKLGGLFGRAAGLGGGGAGSTEAAISYKLTPVGGGAAQLQASANGKGDGDAAGLNAALDKAAQAVAKQARKQ
ncbi:MAG TPA: hypothetical protein VF546_06420 [Pyrinomonadaceae bacterium]